MKNILAFLLANNDNRLLFVPCDEGIDGERALRIIHSIDSIAPGDPELSPLSIAPGDESESTIWALDRWLSFQSGAVGSQAIHTNHLWTLLRNAQAFISRLTAELPKPSPLAPPDITPHNTGFMAGTQVLSLRIRDGRVVTEFFDIPTRALRDD